MKLTYLQAGKAVVAAMLLASTHAQAQLMTFSTPNFALPAHSGDGLIGDIYANVPFPAALSDRDLAFARNYIDAPHTASGSFVAGTVNFPQSGATISTSASFADFLGANAATVQDGAMTRSDLLPNSIHNSIIEFNGFFANYIANTTFTFQLSSDDGSSLSIQNTPVITSDGIHPFGSTGPESVTFGDVGLYAINILYFEAEPNDAGIEWKVEDSANPGSFIGVNQALLFTSQIPLPGSVALLALGAFAGFSQRRKPATAGN